MHHLCLHTSVSQLRNDHFVCCICSSDSLEMAAVDSLIFVVGAVIQLLMARFNWLKLVQFELLNFVNLEMVSYMRTLVN